MKEGFIVMLIRLTALCMLWVLLVSCNYAKENAEDMSTSEETESTVYPYVVKNAICSPDDFNNIVIGQSTMKDVDIISDIHTLNLGASGYYTEFPIGDGKAMCFVFRPSDYVVTKMYVGEADSTFTKVDDFSQLEELHDSQLEEYLNN